MSGSPLNIKLNCKSWQQLSAIHSRDLCRGAFFLKTSKPPPLGTMVRISLTLPSGSTVELAGQIHKLIGEGELEGRGPGIDISIRKMPHSVMWLVESALSSAGFPPGAKSEPAASATPPAASAASTAPAAAGATATTPSATATAAPTPVTAAAPLTASPPPLPPPPAPAMNDDSPALEDNEALVSAEADLVKALWTELGGMSKMNAFQLLDLPTSAGDDEVRFAFQALSKKYHPDRFTQYESFEIRELANEVFILLRDAYRNIADHAGRQKLLATLPQAQLSRTPPPIPTRAVATPPPLPSPPKAMPAQPLGDAVIQFAAPNTAAGTQPLDLSTQAPAIGKDDDRVEFALRFLESGQYEQALRILRVEARKDPNNTRALAGVELAAGRLALADGDRMEAAERFEAALEIDPLNERAAREIAELSRHATSQRRSLLSKLMKKV